MGVQVGFLTREDITKLRARYKTWRKTRAREMASDSDSSDDKKMLKESDEPKKYPSVPREVFFDWIIAIKNIVLPMEGVVGDGVASGSSSNSASGVPDTSDPSEIKAFHAVLTATKDMAEIDVEAFIRYYEFDVSYRFDLRFCEYQKRMAIDTLMLFAYIPFVFLFAYFLVQGRGLGSGYYMNANIVDFFLGQEFDVSDDLRFVKTYWDIGSDGEFWEFVTGPLIGGLWAGDGPESTVNATQLVQQTLMPIGALKIRQKRVEAEICTSKQYSMFANNVEEYTLTEEGVEYIRNRQKDFNAFCYPELDYANDNTDKGLYPLINELHDGVDRYSMDSEQLPNHLGRLPPVFVESKLLTEDMIVDDEKFMFPAFQYQSCSNLNGSDSAWVRGKLGRYHCDGHGIVFPFSWSLEKVNKAVDILMNGITAEYIDPHTGYLTQKQIPWIDSQTRAISFDIIFFSKDVELFTFSQFLVEVTATGCWIPIKSLRSFELFVWDAHSHAYFFFVFLYVLYICWYWMIWLYNYITRVLDINAGSKNVWNIIGSIGKGLMGFWVVFDFINLSLFLVALVLTMRTWTRGVTDQSVLQTTHYPTDYENIATEAELASYISAANGLLTFCRIFYFLQMHPQLNLLTKTVHKAATDLVGIVVIFIIVFTAFSLVTYVIYGLQLEDFRSFQQTIVSLCRMLIGDFNYEDLMNERRIMTPVIFSLYNALAVFILLNMVIAILDEAFGKVQEEKFVPRKLLSLMNSSDDQEFEFAGDYVERSIVWDILFNNPPVKEFLYWWRRLHLELLILTGHDRESREWRDKLHQVKRSNPRIYWSMRVREIRKNMKTYAFKDKCRLIPRELDYILMDQLGEDFLLLRDSLLWKPARAMHREPQRLLENILQFHHLWQINVEAITQTGKTLKAMKEVQEKKREEKLRQMFLKQQEKNKAESRQDTFKRLRQKYGRDPTTEELMTEIASVPPDDKQDIEKVWMYQVRRLHQITDIFTKLAETRERDFSGGGPKLRFTEWMIDKVSKSTQRHLAESMGRIVQEEIQQEMAEGDPDEPEDERETMKSVLEKWRDGHYDEMKRQGKLHKFEREEEDASSSAGSVAASPGATASPTRGRKGSNSPAPSPTYGGKLSPGGMGGRPVSPRPRSPRPKSPRVGATPRTPRVGPTF